MSPEIDILDEWKQELQRNVRWATGALAKMDHPAAIALLLAMREEYLLVDMDRLARRVRAMTARLELERIRRQTDRARNTLNGLLDKANAAAEGEEKYRLYDAYMYKRHGLKSLEDREDRARERWDRECGITV